MRVVQRIGALLLIAFAGSAANGQTPLLSAPPPALSSQQLMNRLEQAEARIRELEERERLHGSVAERVMSRLPSTEADLHATNYNSLQGDNLLEFASHECPDCGKADCLGKPHVCDLCDVGPAWGNDSGWSIVPFGQLRGEMIYSEAEQTADAVIFLLAPNNPGVDDDQFTVHGKTSMLNFAISGPNIGDWQTGGTILMNFLGPQPLRNNSGPNVLNAYGEIKNDNWRFAFGRMLDLFSPIGPSTVNLGQQRGAGNVGIFRGAMHVDRYINVHDQLRWTLSGRVAQNAVNDFLLVPSARGIDNGIPNFEGRIGFELGPECDGIRPLELGISGLWGETRAFDPGQIASDPITMDPIFLPAVNNVSTTAGGNIDFQLRGARAGVRGEFWIAQTAGTYFVAVLQSLNPATGSGIRSIGGWAEAYYKVTDITTVYVGYGIDDPRNQDVGFLTPGPSLNDPGQRTLNQVMWTSILWNVTDFFQLGFEVSHRKTHYLNPATSSRGMLYHFSSTLKY